MDQAMVGLGLVSSRSQAESWIKLGKVKVDECQITKPGFFVGQSSKIKLTAPEQYVSRAGLKLASAMKAINLSFADKAILDVGSSTGGFTDYALKHGAKKVIAVDVGTNQLHPSLRDNPRIELHEQTDIRALQALSEAVDIVVIDVSFISLREILPHVASLCNSQTKIAAMVKPQFEVGGSAKHKGVIKNDAMRREILRNFEAWSKKCFVVLAKSDSEVTGSKGNRERFYLLRPIKTV